MGQLEEETLCSSAISSYYMGQLPGPLNGRVSPKGRKRGLDEVMMLGKHPQDDGSSREGLC